MSENTLRGSLTPTSGVLQGTLYNNNPISVDIPKKQSLQGKALIPEKIYGDSAYEIAVKNGFEGTEEEWLLSLKGDPGYTPQKGVDYFTEADKKELISDLLASLPIAEEVSV